MSALPCGEITDIHRYYTTFPRKDNRKHGEKSAVQPGWEKESPGEEISRKECRLSLTKGAGCGIIFRVWDAPIKKQGRTEPIRQERMKYGFYH